MDSIFSFHDSKGSLLTTEIRDRQACWQDYEILRSTSKYPSSSPLSYWNPFASFSAETFCYENFFHSDNHDGFEENRPTTTTIHRRSLVGQLCVVTGVYPRSAAYYVAQELALSAGMHVILVGKSKSNVQACRELLQEEAVQRLGRKAASLIQIYAVPNYNLASLDSVRTAAHAVMEIIQTRRQQQPKRQQRHSQTSAHSGQLHYLINMAHVGKATAKLTADGLEYNVGCNFIATHFFTTLLLPYMTHGDARVITAASMGHCLGTNFNPTRFAAVPAEGGAPPGFLQQTSVDHHDALQQQRPQHHQNQDHQRQVASQRISLLEATDGTILQVVEDRDTSEAYSEEDLRRAVQKSGTQVGRSKMALIADTYHMSRLYADQRISFFTFHLLPPPPRSNYWSMGYWSASSSSFNELAALAPLRAALDPQLGRMDSSSKDVCYYLHSDGNPWTPMEPARDLDFGRACYEAAESILRPWKTQPTEQLQQFATAYTPPKLS